MSFFCCWGERSRSRTILWLYWSKAPTSWLDMAGHCGCNGSLIHRLGLLGPVVPVVPQVDETSEASLGSMVN